MKNIVRNSGWILAVVLGISLTVVLVLHSYHNHDHSGTDAHNHDEHDHSDHEGHDHEAAPDGIKTVDLNEAQYKAAGIKTSGFARKNMSEVVKVNGFTKLPPQNKAVVSAPLSGIIKQIQVVEGQYVKAGQLLATLQSLDYNNLRLEREKLSAELNASQTNLEYLKLEFARQKELSEGNVNARKTFEKVSSDLHLEESKIKSLQAQIAILNQNIDMGGNAGSPIIPVLAPIGGYVAKIEVNIGSTASPATMLFEIVDNSKIHVDLEVYEKDIYKIKVGQQVRFVLTNQNGEELAGKVFGIGQALDSKSKTITIHAEITNNARILLVGMYVNAVIDLGSQEVDVLPADAVVKADGREFIFVLDAKADDHDHAHEHDHDHAHEGEHAEETNFHFKRIEVKTGTSQLGSVQVTTLQAFKNKDKIVTEGAFYLQSHLQKSEGGGGHGHAH